MTFHSSSGVSIEHELVDNYLTLLIDMFFKILPMRENNEKTLITYMCNFQADLLGCNSLICELHNNPLFLTLINTLQYLIDNISNEDVCPIQNVRKKVFGAISTCNKLKSIYQKEESE